MSRNIKRIAHDLIPLSDAATELSSIITELLAAIKPRANFDNSKTEEYLEECLKASKNLAISTKLIKSYIQEVNDEADREGIVKD